MIRTLFTVLTVLGLVAETAAFADPTITPPMIICQKGGSHAQGPNTIYFDAQDCGGNFPTNQYYGAISSLQVNGGNGGFQVLQPAQGNRAGMWFYAMVGNANYGVSVVYFRALQ